MEINAQSPRFSFSSDMITLETSHQPETPPFKVYKGKYTSTAEVIDKKAIIGSFTNNDKTIQFTPLLPFQKGTDYTVSYAQEMYSFTIDLDPSYDRLKVEVLYPNSDALPSNFLKWYIQFSKPVNPSKIYEHIYLIDNQTNTKVDRALLPLESPLLSDDGTLLTLWIEPGRQKRDLGPNIRLGEVLVPDASYTLVIDNTLKDHQGIPMNIDYKHSFTVRLSDRTKPTMTTWQFDLPTPNTKEPLRIHLQEYLDYGSLQNSLHIVDASGKTIKGDFIINTNQKTVIFRPLENWSVSDYTLHCKSIIEDISGNNLKRLFDQDVTEKIVPPILKRTFTIK